MYWAIALIVFIGGVFVSWITLNRKWRKIVGYPSVLMENLIQTTRVLNPDLPGHPWFMDLKWTIIRHAFVSIVSALLIYFLYNISVVTWVICLLNFLYAFLAKSRYSYRKKLIATMSAEEHEASLVELWANLVNASKVCVIYSFVSAVVLCVLSATICCSEVVLHENVCDETYQKAYEAAYNEAYKEAYAAGYEAGHSDGHEKGYTEGAESEHVISYTEGYEEGYSLGREEAYPEGYKNGFYGAVFIIDPPEPKLASSDEFVMSRESYILQKEGEAAAAEARKYFDLSEFNRLGIDYDDLPDIGASE